MRLLQKQDRRFAGSLSKYRRIRGAILFFLGLYTKLGYALLWGFKSRSIKWKDYFWANHAVKCRLTSHGLRLERLTVTNGSAKCSPLENTKFGKQKRLNSFVRVCLRHWSLGGTNRIGALKSDICNTVAPGLSRCVTNESLQRQLGRIILES